MLAALTWLTAEGLHAQNLVPNGSFTLGNTQFGSEYGFTGFPNCANSAEDQYTVGTNPAAWNCTHLAVTMGDHTTGVGNMLIANGRNTAHRVWFTLSPITVVPNTTYFFEAWIANWSTTSVGAEAARLTFRANGVDLVTASASGVGIWTPVSTIWNSGANTTASLELFNSTPTIIGNDFAVDDVFLGDTSSIPPFVSGVFPDHGPNTGVSGVVITGTGFFGASAVHFGSNPASFTVDSDTQITADLSSTNTVGFVDVSVTDSNGTGTLMNGFDYFVPPVTIGTPCGVPYLTWSGSPTLGETFTVTTENLGSDDQFLLIDWSNIPNPKFAPYLFNCRVIVRPDQVVSLGNNPAHSIFIPQDVALIGVHLRIQSLVRARPSVTTQALDTVIGE